MTLAVTQTEVVTWSVLGFLYLLALLLFVRVLLRGPRPLHWRSLRFGLFAEREPHEDDVDDEEETQIRKPR